MNKIFCGKQTSTWEDEHPSSDDGDVPAAPLREHEALEDTERSSEDEAGPGHGRADAKAQKMAQLGVDAKAGATRGVQVTQALQKGVLQAQRRLRRSQAPSRTTAVLPTQLGETLFRIESVPGQLVMHKF